jgi:broad specificity phosphatase PhoE
MKYTILDKIRHYPSHEKLTVLMRHADREKIPDGEFGNDILINKKGKIHSLELGILLQPFQINDIFSSPIQRCVQTGEYISEGYDKSIIIKENTALGSPGLHITDEVAAGKFYLKHGFDESYKKFMNHEKMPGVASMETYGKLMTEFLMDNTTEKGITLFITHDSLIAFYHYYLNKTIYTRDNWINYLSGLVLKK